MKLRPVPVIVVCALVSAASAKPQIVPRGLSVIVVKTETQATKLQKELQAGESFDAAAMKYSQGSSAMDGGYVGAVKAEDLRPEMRRAVAPLAPAEVSPVIAVGEDFLILRWSTPQEENWRSQYAAGLQALQQMRYTDAVRFFSQAIQIARSLGPEDTRLARSLHGLSQTYTRLQHYPGAEPLERQSLTILEKVLGEEHPGILPGLENLAQVVMEEEKYAEAGQLYRRILSLRWEPPSSGTRADVLEKFAAVLTSGYLMDTRFNTAFEEFARAIDSLQLRHELYVAMSNALLRFQLIDQAQQVLQRAARAFPNSNDIRYAIARAYSRAQSYEKALEVLEEAARDERQMSLPADRQQHGILYETIGRTNAQLLRFDEALAAYTTALRDFESSESHIGAAQIYFQRGMLDEALAQYKGAVGISPKSAEAHLGIAEVSLQLGRFTESATAAETAAKLDPNSERSLYVRAMALVRAGHPDGQKALEEYQSREAEVSASELQLREIDRLDHDALNSLSQGRPEEALRLLRDALAAHPSPTREMVLRTKLGLVQSRMGQHDAAAKTFQYLIDGGSDDAIIYRNLAAEYRQLQDPRFTRYEAIYQHKYDEALQSGLR